MIGNNDNLTEFKYERISVQHFQILHCAFIFTHLAGAFTQSDLDCIESTHLHFNQSYQCYALLFYLQDISCISFIPEAL